jgi:hypothetical protein
MRQQKNRDTQKEVVVEADDGRQCDLNFKVSKDFHTWFKSEAARRGLSMKDLLEKCFRCYLNVYGSEVHSKRLRFE